MERLICTGVFGQSGKVDERLIVDHRSQLGGGARPRYLFAVDAPESLRFRLTVHYDGSAFHGWQVQPDQRTVQGDLESALSRLADSPRSVIGSGRTDTGVHATGQVASVDMPVTWDAARAAQIPERGAVRRRLDRIDRPRQADFHPRYDALKRTYRYEVGLRPESASPFHRRWCWPLGGSGGHPLRSIDRDWTAQPR